MTTIPAVPICRVGHYELLSGPVDFSIEHLQAAAEAFSLDPAVVAPRIRIEGYGQDHLDENGIAVEAAGGAGGPSVGWCDNLTVSGTELLADLHVPQEIADAMEAFYPSRSIEGCFGWQSATGKTHDFIATGLLLLGTSWPGVATLPDFAEIQAEFATAVAEGEIVAAQAGFAAPEGVEVAVLRGAKPLARLAVAARAPQQLVQAGLNVSDLRMRWYGAIDAGELTDLPESFDPWAWWVLEARADDDGTLYVVVLDEDSGEQWRFDVTAINGSDVTFGAPQRGALDWQSAAATRPVLARYSGGRPASASVAPPTNQEDDHPMTDEERRTFAASYGLDPETATDADIHAAATTRAAELAEAEPEPVVPEPVVEVPEPVAARTAEISTDTLAQLQADAAEGVAARQAQVAAERDGIVSAALAAGKITPAESDAWRADLDEAPEVTARAIERLAPGKIPSTSRAVAPQDGGGNPDSLKRVLATVPRRSTPTQDKVA